MSDGTFKTPALPPGGLPSGPSVSNSEPVEEAIKSEEPSISKQPLPVPPLNYAVPPWACEPPPSSGYRLEVLKTGSIVDCVNLDQRQHSTFITIGRLPNCDVVLDHPSISRYHCILQYGDDIMNRTGKGWHLFDLGSTHGSKMNKRRLPEKQYLRAYVGFVFQFGGSSRLLNLIGPDADQEAEWDCSPTEMRDKIKKKALEAKLAAAVRKEFDEDKQKDTQEDEGINWGMDYGETDGGHVYELEGHLEEDGDAYYETDPKKALAKFFDREGFEMKFEYSESGSGHTHKWICSIELPIEIDGVDRACIAQASTTTSKKDAAIQCALEACKILDRHGILRHAKTKTYLKRKTLADNDYYDEDDDLYLDRTGQLEQQREKRRLWAERDAGRAAPEKKETFETLSKKLEETRDEMKDIQKELDALSHTISNKGLENSDSLDDYCRQLSAAGGIKDDLKTKTQKSMLRQKLVKLTHEAQTLERLVKIATPAKMPDLKLTTSSGNVVGSNKQAFLRKMMMVGRSKKDSDKKEEPKTCSVADDKKLEAFVPDEEEDTSKEKESEKLISKTNIAEIPGSSQDVENNKKVKNIVISQNEVSKSSIPVKQNESSISSKNQDISDVVSEKLRIPEIKESQPVTEVKRKPADVRNGEATLKKRKVHQNPDAEEKTKNMEYGSGCQDKDEQYATWLPPTDQSGDGRTKLHDKFGGRY